MASIRKRGESYEVAVCVVGPGGPPPVRRTATFDTRAEAKSWGIRTEAAIVSGKAGRAADKTVGDLLRRYAETVSPSKAGARWEQTRIRALADDPLSAVKISALDATHIAAWRDRRLRVVQRETVRREWTLISCAIVVAIKEWRWLSVNPMTDVKRPARGRPRDRLITDEEIERLLFALGYTSDGCPATVTARVGAAFAFAIETGMRCGEICALEWRDVHADDGICTVRAETAGAGKTEAARREVPISPAALRVLRGLPVAGASVFGLSTSQVDALFRKAKAKAAVADVTFHDTRHLAITRLARVPGMDVLSLAKIVGHRDLRQLQVYFNPSATDLARLLG